MAGIRVQGGVSNNLVEVDADNNLQVNLPTDVTQAGYNLPVAEVSTASDPGGSLRRPLDSSNDFRLRVGTDSLLWQDVFNHTTFNTSRYQGVTSTMTMGPTSGFFYFNLGSSTTSGHVARLQTYRTFPTIGTYSLYVDMWVGFQETAQANVVMEFGLGLATTTTTPTDGIFFRVTGNSAFHGVVNKNGSETTTANLGLPSGGVISHYLIVVHSDSCEFWKDDVLLGVVDRPLNSGHPSYSPSLPLLFRQFHTGTVAAPQRMQIGEINVSLGDMNSSRMWATQMAGNGWSAHVTPDGATAGQTTNYSNTAAPVSASLSNTAAGYTTLGGQWQFAAVAGAETDYALFAYQVPATTASQPGRNLVVRGVRIDTVNTGAAVATTATLLQWGLGIGSTAVSLATADSATAGTRAPRRLTLGLQSFAIGAAIGSVASPIDVNLDSPIVVEAGTFLHVILKMPLGTATASQVIRGTCLINGYFE